MSSEDQRREELIEQIKKQVALEERAHRMVEKLTETTPSEEYLKDALPCISSSQYSDIVVERAITKLCGYPLCRNTLTAVPNQKYHISLKNKTVYDISDRKNFCSNKCYSASQHLQKQIPSEPVWLRDNSQSEPLKFLAEEINKGSAGTVVFSGHSQQVVNEGQVAEMLDSLTLGDGDDDEDDDSGSDTLEDVARDFKPPVTAHTQQMQSVTSSSGEKPLPSSDSLTSSAALKWNSSDQFQRGLFKSCVVDVSSPVVSAAESHQSSPVGQRSLISSDHVLSVATVGHQICNSRKLHEVPAAEQMTLQRVKTCLYEWKTTELVEYLKSTCGEPLRTGVSSKVNTNENVSCAEDVNKDNQENSKSKQGQYEKLYERRVGEFYGIKPRVHFADTCKHEAEDDDKEIVLASVHSCSQNSLRRKIVLDKLSNVVPRLLESTSLCLTDVSTALRDLVHCFRLTSHNITLKSVEWSVVGYVMLRLLAVRDETVHSALTSEAAVKTIEKLLSSAALTASDIDEIVYELQSDFAEEASSKAVTEGILD